MLTINGNIIFFCKIRHIKYSNVVILVILVILAQYIYLHIIHLSPEFLSSNTLLLQYEPNHRLWEHLYAMIIIEIGKNQ